MAFDYGKVIADLNRHKGDGDGSENGKYRYRLVYPSEGKLRVRILFNPASGLITRLVNRHKIGDNQIPCMATYTSKDDCPICKVIKEAEAMGVKVPYQLQSKVRAICLAQYHSSSYEIDGVKQGDIVMLMVPWTVYKDGIMKWMSDISEDEKIMAKVLSKAESNVLIIEKGKDNKSWTCRPDPNVTIQSAADDEAFAELLESQDSLYELVKDIHEVPTEADINLMNSVAEDLRNSIVNPKTQMPEITPKADEGATSLSSVLSPDTKAPESAPKTSATLGPESQSADKNGHEDAPECYGKNYVPQTSTDASKIVQKVKCKLCPYKEDCALEDGNAPF